MYRHRFFPTLLGLALLQCASVPSAKATILPKSALNLETKSSAKNVGGEYRDGDGDEDYSAYDRPYAYRSRSYYERESYDTYYDRTYTPYSAQEYDDNDCDD
jgi:hypothetical protein